MRDKDRFPDAIKPMIGWQISIKKEELVDALTRKMTDLEDELDGIGPQTRTLNYVPTGTIAQNPQELINKLHERRFSRFKASEVRADLSKCKSKLGQLSEQPSYVQLNQRYIEFLGIYLDVPSILRRVADELDPYYQQ